MLGLFQSIIVTLDKLFATMAQIVPRLEKWRRLGKMHVVKSDSLASAVYSLNTSKRSLDGPRTAPAGDSLTALDSRQEGCWGAGGGQALPGESWAGSGGSLRFLQPEVSLGT